jgi:hypothetical protein
MRHELPSSYLGARRPAHPVDGMSLARHALVLTAFALSACASTQREIDAICPAIAAFANASTDAAVHSVQLTTDWGGTYTKSEDPNEWTMAAKRCEHGGFEPGRVLCDYLIEETSTEFPGINYRRALRCIGVRVSGKSPTDDHKLPPKASSRHVSGVRRGVSVTLSQTEGTETIPPTLTIEVQGSRL